MQRIGLLLLGNPMRCMKLLIDLKKHCKHVVMRLYIFFVAVFSALSFFKMEAQTPPYSGTIFIDPDIITSSDSSSIKSTTYAGRGQRQVYDRRVNNWININAYLFDVVWKDGVFSEAVVNPEFGTLELAKVEAEKYARLIGQLPFCLRLDVDQIWIHQGVQPFGGGNNSILIHTGQSAAYEASGIIEETLVHEAAHTSLDFAHAASSGWKTAQSKDVNFISTYARDNPTREDIAESFLPWLMVKYRASKISTADFNKITQAIPNRLAYFDGQSFNLYPFVGNIVSTNNLEGIRPKVYVYPNPSSEFIQIAGITESINYEIYNIQGAKVLEGIYAEGKQINIQHLPNHMYFLKLKNGGTMKFITE